MLVVHGVRASTTLPRLGLGGPNAGHLPHLR